MASKGTLGFGFFIIHFHHDALVDSSPRPYSHLYTELAPTNPKDKKNILMHLAKDQATFERKAEVLEEKLKGKSLLLDNIESMRLAKKPKGGRKTSVGAHMMGVSGRQRLDHLTTKDTFSYEKQLLPLHRLWLAYIKDLLSVSQKDNTEGALVRADYHGAFLRVIQSKCPSRVGKGGIVVQETMNTFKIVEPASDRLISVPKGGTVFSCQVEGLLTWHLFGDQLRQSSGLRSSKKFKAKSSVAL